MNIQNILLQASKLRIGIVGDLITDRYIDGTVTRISPEAPVSILRVSGVRANPGGAGNVVENLRGLGIQTSFFHQKDIPVKTRVMSGTHHILRMDEENEPQWMSYDDLDIGLDYGIKNDKFDCVIISDYGKGTISRDVSSKVIRQCNLHNVPVVVDTKSQHNLFFSSTLIKSNLGEWVSFMERRRDFNGIPHFLQTGDIQNLVITDGARGIYYHDQDFGQDQICGIKTEISDPCGAGDTVTAILGMMIALKYPVREACELANIAASEVCRWAGVRAISKEDLIRRFNEVKI